MAYGPYRRQSRGTGLQRFFGELELAVMEVVWEHQPLSVSGVLEKLSDETHSWAYTTIMTVMRRLTDKGWLAAKKQGRAYVYSAVYSRDEAKALIASEIVRSLVEDFGKVAVAQFAKELDHIDPGQLAQLADLAGEGEDDET